MSAGFENHQASGAKRGFRLPAKPPADHLELQIVADLAQGACPSARIRQADSYFLRLTHSGDDRVTGQLSPQPSKRRPEIRYLLHRT
jgi:hypothetical protein